MKKPRDNSFAEECMNRLFNGLCPLMGILILAGCSSYRHHHGMMSDGKSEAYWQKGQQDMEGLINRTVKDSDKAKQVNVLVGEIINELKTSREQERAYHRDLYTLNASYTATPDEFSKILNEANIQRMQSSAKVLSLRFKMKNLMTADEWKALSDGMIAYSGRYQHGGSGAKTGY
jgi:CRISPR-associated protein Cas8b1/Cst1 subtype I-B